MGRTACTEPQCLHKGALYLTPTLMKVKWRRWSWPPAFHDRTWGRGGTSPPIFNLGTRGGGGRWKVSCMHCLLYLWWMCPLDNELSSVYIILYILWICFCHIDTLMYFSKSFICFIWDLCSNTGVYVDCLLANQFQPSGMQYIQIMFKF